MLNLVLQRSQILQGAGAKTRAIDAWTEGQHEPLAALIENIGTQELITRAATLVYAEYKALGGHLQTYPPQEISDIGCGYGFFDLFLAQDFECRVNLIDLEVSENRHFGYEKSGAAYSNLTTARNFLVANGIADERIFTFNPASDDLSDITQSDLAVSFLSCGFHYPWSTYAAFFRDAVVPEGHICLDVRRRAVEATLSQLAAYGTTTILPKGNEPKAERVMVQKVAKR